jgi:hypothetical protein
MESEVLKPILAGMVRHGLTTVGGALVTDGVIQSSDVNGFVGAGMVVAGVAWSWWNKVGQAEVGALLKKLTASRSHEEAVEKAQAMPAADASAVNKSIVKAVVGALLIAFALSFLVAAPSAQAQEMRRPAMTGNIAKDLKADFGENEKPRLITGNAEKDAHAIWDKIVSASNADLKYASALAGKANTSASLVRKQCYDAILDLNTQVNGMNLTDADGKVLPQPDPKLFTGVEQAAETIDNLSPQGKLFTSCAGMAQLTKTNVLTLVNAIVTGAAGFAAMPIIPGL